MFPASGEIFALATALFWTVTGLSFEWAGKRVGSLPLNLIRLAMAFVFLGVYTSVTRGMPLPLDAGGHAWFWLLISGLIGFVFGDYFLFQAYVLIGSRISLLIMSMSPILTGILGYFIFGEKLNLLSLLGIALTLTGISLVILNREKHGLSFTYSSRGIAFAVLGAIGQSVGLVASKYGMGEYHAFAATQIRIIAGIAGFLVVFVLGNHWPKLLTTFHDTKAMGAILLGAFFGPFLGVAFSLLAVQHTDTAIAATIMSIMPVLIIPFSIWLFREKVKPVEVIGAAVTVLGVALLFML